MRKVANLLREIGQILFLSSWALQSSNLKKETRFGKLWVRGFQWDPQRRAAILEWFFLTKKPPKTDWICFSQFASSEFLSKLTPPHPQNKDGEDAFCESIISPHSKCGMDFFLQLLVIFFSHQSWLTSEPKAKSAFWRIWTFEYN